MKYRVSGARSDWTVTSPSGEREWPRLPSQPAACNLARSLAGIDAMLAGINRPALTVVRPPKQKSHGEYGFGPIKPRRSS